MTDPNDYAREPHGPENWTELESLFCSKCPGVLDVVGGTMGPGPGARLHQCRTCKSIYIDRLEDGHVIKGYIFRGRAYGLAGSEIAHPDDVWG